MPKWKHIAEDYRVSDSGRVQSRVLRGTKPSYTAEVAEQVCALVGRKVPYKLIYTLVGVSPRTAYNIVQRSKRRLKWTDLEQSRTPKRGRAGVRVVKLGPVRRRVHVLVLEAFVGAKPPGKVARHLNGDVCDNRIENLAWVGK